MDQLDLTPIDSDDTLDLKPLDLKPIESPKESSGILESAEDIATMGAQGLTAGFSDEAIAAARAILEKAKTGEDYSSLYEKYRDIERERVRQAEARSPILSTAAEITGAAIPAIVSGGLSAGAVTGAKLLPSIGRIAATGALGGAAAAVGKSEAPLGEDTLKEAVTGAAEGAVIGTGVAGLGKLAGAGLGSLAKKVKESDVGRQALLARQLAKEGEDLASAAFETRSKGASESIAKKIWGSMAGIGTDIEQSLVSAEKQGIKIAAEQETAPVLEKGIEALQDTGLLGKETSGLVEKLKNLLPKTDPATGIVSSSGLNPVEANALRREIRDAVADAAEKGKLNIKEIEHISDLNNLIKEKLNLIPDFKKSNELYEEFARKVPGAAGGRGFKEIVEYINPVTGELEKVRTGVQSFSEKTFQKVQQDFESLINKIRAGGITKKDQVAAFNALKENLSDLERRSPELLKRYGIDPKEIISTVEKEADVAKIGAGIHGIQEQEGLKKRALGVASPSGALYRTAGLVGEAEAGVSKLASKIPSAVKTPVQLANRLYSMPFKALGSVGEKLAQSGSPRAQAMGKELIEATRTGNIDLSRKITFIILQNPKLRDELVPILGEE